jgi:Bacterial Ig domain
VTVTVLDSKGRTVPAGSTAQVTPASYKNGAFTPPVLSGNFTVPSTVVGPATVNLTLQASLDGIPLTNAASTPLFVGPPTTSIILPANGASLAGTEYLDASASSATTRVEFLLFGGKYGFAAPVICTATPTLYGWLCGWNTKTVPNGSYALVSEAFNSAGSAFSSGVSITVHN